MRFANLNASRRILVLGCVAFLAYGCATGTPPSTSPRIQNSEAQPGCPSRSSCCCTSVEANDCKVAPSTQCGEGYLRDYPVAITKP
jgi:hypothetical protein